MYPPSRPLSDPQMLSKDAQHAREGDTLDARQFWWNEDWKITSKFYYEIMNIFVVSFLYI